MGQGRVHLLNGRLAEASAGQLVRLVGETADEEARALLRLIGLDQQTVAPPTANLG